MDRLTQLEVQAGELAAAATTLARSSRSGSFSGDSAGRAYSHPSGRIQPDVSGEAQQARGLVKSHMTKLQTLTDEPADFLQRLTSQSQLLACLQWLGEFQVLACVPLSGSVPVKDIADIAGVPEAQLLRVVRYAAAAGFLHEPQPGHIEHTALSGPFVTKPSLLDAVMFLSETATPAALHMPAATQRFGPSDRPSESAYNLSANVSDPFDAACEQCPKLQRQWNAYLRYGVGDVGASLKDVLARLDWTSLGQATIVHAGAFSTALAKELTALYPALHFIVQISDHPHERPSQSESRQSSQTPSESSFLGWPSRYLPQHGDIHENKNPRITVQQRRTESAQTVYDAAIYLLHLPPAAPGASPKSLLKQIAGELKAHLGVLRSNSSSTLVLAAHLLPEPGTVDMNVEIAARLRDLALSQIANEHEIELAEVMNVLDSVRDRAGRLALVNRLHSRHTATVAFEIRYQSDADQP